MLVLLLPVLALIAWRLRRRAANPFEARSVAVDRGVWVVLAFMALLATWVAEVYPVFDAIYWTSERSLGYAVMWLAIATIAPCCGWFGFRRARRVGGDRGLRLQRAAVWYSTSGLVVGTVWVMGYFLAGGF